MRGYNSGMLRELQRELSPSLYGVAVVGFVAFLDLYGYSAGVIIVAASAFAIVGGALLVRRLLSDTIR